MHNNKLAPIVVFAFNRVDTLKNTIESLKKNKEAKDSELYIFVDGPRANREGEKEQVYAVQEYVKTISGFKNIQYTFSETNKGLAPSVISGTTTIINRYEKVIVVEDDLYVSPCFLTYMNTLLDKYQNDQRIFQISGYGLKIKVPDDYKYDIYMHIRAHSWTWATWKDRWDSIDWEVKDYPKLVKDKRKQKAFNKGGSDLFKMLKDYMEGRNNSWYIRFTYSMFLQKKYSISPVKSLVINDGFRSQSTHCNTYNRYTVDFFNEFKTEFAIPKQIEWNPIISKKVYKYWSIPYRIYGKIMTILKKITS